METLKEILVGIPWFAWIAIVAILGGITSGIIKMILRHSERMEMIERGINPGPPDED
jgi:hypothetical protein